jgi:hypothetical protein
VLLPVASVEDIRARFDSHRYVGVRSLLDRDLAAMLYDHLRRRAAADTLRLAIAPGMEGASEGFADPLAEHVLAGMQPRVEEISGRRLFPTYSFVRIYRRGNELRRHRDRPSCEISVSINLGQVSDQPWPLRIEGPRGRAAGELGPGDALRDRGIECAPWREPFDGEEAVQVFLHYVDQDGPHREYRFDRRPALGLGVETRLPDRTS